MDLTVLFARAQYAIGRYGMSWSEAFKWAQQPEPPPAPPKPVSPERREAIEKLKRANAAAKAKRAGGFWR